MKNKHLKDIELLKKIFETLPEKKIKKVEEHLNKCEECKQRYQFFTNKFKPFLGSEEKHLASEETNGVFRSFIKEKSKTAGGGASAEGKSAGKETDNTITTQKLFGEKVETIVDLPGDIISLKVAAFVDLYPSP